MVRLGAPVEAAARRLGGPGEGCAEHHGVGTAGDGLDDVAARADTAVGDDVDVAAAALVEVVAAGGSDVGNRRGHRRVDPERATRRVRGTTTEADEHAGRAGAHEVQRGGVRRRATDDDGHVEPRR